MDNVDYTMECLVYIVYTLYSVCILCKNFIMKKVYKGWYTIKDSYIFTDHDDTIYCTY